MAEESSEQGDPPFSARLQERAWKLAGILGEACGADARIIKMDGVGFRIEVIPESSALFSESVVEILEGADSFGHGRRNVGVCEGAVDIVWCEVVREESPPARTKRATLQPVERYRFLPILGPGGEATGIEAATNIPGRVVIRDASRTSQSLVMSAQVWEYLAAAIASGNSGGPTQDA